MIRCDECLELKHSKELWFCKECTLIVCSHCVVSSLPGGHTSHERSSWDSMQPLHAAMQRFRAREKGYGPERMAELESKLSEIFEEMRPAVLTEIRNQVVVCNSNAREKLEATLGQLYSLDTRDDDGRELEGYEDPDEDWDLKILEKALALGSRPEVMGQISEIREGMKGRLMMMTGAEIAKNYAEYLTATRSSMGHMRAPNLNHGLNWWRRYRIRDMIRIILAILGIAIGVGFPPLGASFVLIVVLVVCFKTRFL